MDALLGYCDLFTLEDVYVSAPWRLCIDTVDIATVSGWLFTDCSALISL